MKPAPATMVEGTAWPTDTPGAKQPERLEGNPGDWKAICRLEDIPVLGARRVSRPAGIDVALFRTDQDQVFALLDRCPHRAGPLSQGIVFGTSVACPLHNWSIGLDDGNARAPDAGCTPRFAVRVEQGTVHLDANELATLALDLPRPVAGPQNRP